MKPNTFLFNIDEKKKSKKDLIVCYEFLGWLGFGCGD